MAAAAWQELIPRLRASCNDPVTVSDLDQLQSLVDLVVQTEWLPLGPGDLTHREGRQISAVISSVLEAAAAFKQQGWKVTTSTADLSPGRSLSSPDGIQLWVGVWFSQWARFGGSPVWIDVKEQQGLSVEAIRSAVAAQGPGMTAGPSGGITLPIPLPKAVGRSGVTQAVSERVQQVHRALRTARRGE